MCVCVCLCVEIESNEICMLNDRAAGVLGNKTFHSMSYRTGTINNTVTLMGVALAHVGCG